MAVLGSPTGGFATGTFHGTCDSIISKYCYPNDVLNLLCKNVTLSNRSVSGWGRRRESLTVFCCRGCGPSLVCPLKWNKRLVTQQHTVLSTWSVLFLSELRGFAILSCAPVVCSKTTIIMVLIFSSTA